MGVLDRFLNAMKLNDDYDDDDFFDDEDDDDYVDERPKRRLFKKLEEDEEDDDEDDEPVRPERRARQHQPSVQQSRAVSRSSSSNSNKVTPMRSPRKSGGGMEVCVIKPVTMEDSREITETLVSNRTVVLNLEGLDIEIAQRIIDFTSGSCFAVNGNLQKISNYIFIVSPASVDISGDFQHILNGAYDVPSINSNF